MKKTLIAMAAVAVAGVASAQVTLSGSVAIDMDNTNAVSTAVVGADDVLLTFAASEDLGGGISMKVSTTLETNNGRGNGIASNGYSAALSGGFGTVTYKNYLSGAAGLSAGVSAENDMNDVVGAYTARSRLQYDAPVVVPGLSVTLKWDATNTAVAATTLGSQGSVGATAFETTKYTIGYAAGDVTVALDSSNASGATNAYTVTYDAGVAKVAAYRNTGLNEFTITAPVGGLDVGIHKITGDSAATGFTASYALSKRTSVRYSYVNQTLAGSSSNGSVGSNYRIRLGHTF